MFVVSCLLRLVKSVPVRSEPKHQHCGPFVQVKKQEIRGMLTDVDKEGAASVSFNDFVEMVTPKVLARDPKVCVLYAVLCACVQEQGGLEEGGKEGGNERERERRGISCGQRVVFFFLVGEIKRMSV